MLLSSSLYLCFVSFVLKAMVEKTSMNLEATQGLGSDKIRNVCLRGNEAGQEVTRCRVLGKVGTYKGTGAPRPP